MLFDIVLRLTSGNIYINHSNCPVTSNKICRKSFNASTPKHSIPCKKTVVSQQHERRLRQQEHITFFWQKTQTFESITSDWQVGTFSAICLQMYSTSHTGPDKKGQQWCQSNSLTRRPCKPMGGARGWFPCRGQDGATGMGLKLWSQKHVCATWQHCGYFLIFLLKEIETWVSNVSRRKTRALVTVVQEQGLGWLTRVLDYQQYISYNIYIMDFYSCSLTQPTGCKL